MSAPYEIYVAHDLDSESLLRIVEDSLGLDHYRDPTSYVESNPSLVRRSVPGFALFAHALDGISAEISGEWLGFAPKVCIGFYWDKRSDWSMTYRRILRATSAVLAEVPGDMALVLNGETGELIRRGGRVILTNRHRFTDDDLAEIRVPYEFGRVPGAEDAPGP